MGGKGKRGGHGVAEEDGGGGRSRWSAGGKGRSGKGGGKAGKAGKGGSGEGGKGQRQGKGRGKGGGGGGADDQSDVDEEEAGPGGSNANTGGKGRKGGKGSKGGKSGSKGGPAGATAANIDDCLVDESDGPRERLWAWAREALGREPTEQELSLRTEEVRGRGPTGQRRGRLAFRCTVQVQLPAEVGEGMDSRPEGAVSGKVMPRRREAADSAVHTVLAGFGVEEPVPSLIAKRGGGDGEDDEEEALGGKPERERPAAGSAAAAPSGGAKGGGGAASSSGGPGRGEKELAPRRQVDPAKARELLLSWLMKKYKMPRRVAESQEGVCESLTNQRQRGGGAPLYTCTLVVPSLQLGPVTGTEALPRRKAAVSAAYAVAVAEWGIYVPARDALSQRAMQKQEQLKQEREAKAEQLRIRQKELAERRLNQKLAAKAEVEERAKERARLIFQEKLAPQITASLPGGELPLELTPPQQVTRGQGDRAEQRAASDLGNLCSREVTFLDGPPAFFEKVESLAGQGSAHFVAAVVKIKSREGGHWCPVVGCAYGSKRGAAKSAAARQCLARINVKGSLPVAAEMAEELSRLQSVLGAEGNSIIAGAWPGISTAVAECRKLETKGAGGVKLAVAETAEGMDPENPLSGPWRCLLSGRIPQETGLRDFHGLSATGQRTRLLAIAAACADALARLSQIFGGGDVTSWLRRMAITPMELEDLPRDVVRNLRRCEVDAKHEEGDVRRQLEAWSRHAFRRRHHSAKVPDISAPANAAMDLYQPPEGDGKADPLEIAKRTRGVPLLPVRSLRRPLASLLSEESCLVVSGGTGSGKSTQLPQYIVDDWVGISQNEEAAATEEPSPPPPAEEEEAAKPAAAPVPEAQDATGEAGAVEAAGDAGEAAEVAQSEGAAPEAAPAPPAPAKESSAGKSKPASAPPRRPKVVVTQPRRIAAISVAERVAWERGEELGNSVGYTVRNDARPPRVRDGSIEFVTVGILLRRMMDARDPDLQRYTHVLVDEVHERDLMTDFLLILLKELLARRGDLRVILMSATLDVATFTTYFWDCSVLEVPSGPRYPVEEVYLDDLIYDPEWEAQQQIQIQMQMQAMALQNESWPLNSEGGDAALQGASSSCFQGTVIGGALNPEAAEFVPGRSTWGEPAPSEPTEQGTVPQASEDGDLDEEEDDDEDAGQPQPSEEDDEDDEEAEAEAEEMNDQNYHAVRRQEHVSWDLHQLAQLLLKKEEGARRAFAAEQAELRAEREGERLLAEAEVDLEAELPPEGSQDGGEGGEADAEAFQNSSTGLWWGSFEDGEPLMDLCARLLLHLVFRAESEQGGIFDEKGQPGSILTFLPGWAEIKLVMERLQQAPQASSLWVLPLHSTLAKEDQQKIFQRAPAGKTKVILSTNIAESSVTIDDVLVVVDAGLMRELSYDPVRRISTLETVWVSQSSSIQRKGRAGRVRNGRCYRLFSRSQFDSTAWRTAPEMQRCELSATCLQALAMQREVRDFLARAPDPPPRSSVESALRELVQLGAIAPAPPGSLKVMTPGALRERMLPLGETLSRMPLSPFLGRMLIMGVLFQCVDMSCLLAAVIAAARRPFVCPPGKRKESLGYQRGFDPSSDLLACYAAAETFEEKLLAQQRHGDEMVESADRFAGERFLVPQRLRALLRSRDALREELVRAKLIERSAARKHKSHFDGDEDADDQEVGGWGAWEDHAAGETGDWGSWGRSHRDYHWRHHDPAWDALHAHEGEKELRKALLVAASPMNVAMRRRPFLAKHRTPTGLEAIVAPQSVNAQARPGGKGGGKDQDRRGASWWGPSWWAYGSMQISNKQGFLRTTTLVDPYHIVLFGGLGVERRPPEPGGGGGRSRDGNWRAAAAAAAEEEEESLAVEGLDAGGPVTVIDDWIELQGSEDTVRLLSFMRAEIRRCIHLKVLDPSSNLSENSQWILDEIATTVLRTANRRQGRIVGCLPQQLILPPGGSVKSMDSHRDHEGWGKESRKGGKEKERGSGGGGGKGAAKGAGKGSSSGGGGKGKHRRKS